MYCAYIKRIIKAASRYERALAVHVCHAAVGLLHATPSVEEAIPLKMCCLLPLVLNNVHWSQKNSLQSTWSTDDREDYTVWPYRLLNRGLYPLARQHCPLVEKTCPLKVKIFQFFFVWLFVCFFCQLSHKALSVGRLAPNFAQPLMGQWNTINKSVVLIRLYLV